MSPHLKVGFPIFRCGSLPDVGSLVHPVPAFVSHALRWCGRVVFGASSAGWVGGLASPLSKTVDV